MDGPDYASLVHRARRILGGEAQLCAYLGVQPGELERWLQARRLPTQLYVQLVDVLTTRSSMLQRASHELIARSTRTQIAARAAQRDARSARIASLVLRGTTSGNPKDPLAAALDAALDAAQTALGNVQLLDRRGVLTIRAQRGFEAPFLEFFEDVRPGLHSACGAALWLRRRLVVPDVRTHPVFRGKAAEVMLAAGVMAVVSSPIVDAGGNLIGMISTHYTVPGVRKAFELMKLDAIARRLGAVLGERAAA